MSTEIDAGVYKPKFEADGLLRSLEGYAHILEIIGAGTRGGYQIGEDEMHWLAEMLRGLIRVHGLDAAAAKDASPL